MIGDNVGRYWYGASCTSRFHMEAHAAAGPADPSHPLQLPLQDRRAQGPLHRRVQPRHGLGPAARRRGLPRPDVFPRERAHHAPRLRLPDAGLAGPPHRAPEERQRRRRGQGDAAHAQERLQRRPLPGGQPLLGRRDARLPRLDGQARPLRRRLARHLPPARRLSLQPPLVGRFRPPRRAARRAREGLHARGAREDERHADQRRHRARHPRRRLRRPAQPPGALPRQAPGRESRNVAVRLPEVLFRRHALLR